MVSTNTSSAAAAMAGRSSGRCTRCSIAAGEWPRLAAAWSSERGTRVSPASIPPAEMARKRSMYAITSAVAEPISTMRGAPPNAAISTLAPSSNHASGTSRPMASTVPGTA